MVDLIGEGFDAGLRIASLPDSSLIARRLCAMPRYTVASPAYLKRNGRPTHPMHLAQHKCLGYAYLSTPGVWHYTNSAGEQASVRPAGPLRVNNGEALLPAQAAFSNGAFAQAPWPTRNITMIVPFPAGGQADLAARPVALALERILGKPVIVDNRAGGAGGSIGNAAAARAEPDGYTLLMTLSSLAVLPEADWLFDRPVAYEVSQFAPVARVLADPTLLAVPASAPWKTLRDFVDDARKRPGQIPYGSSGPYGTLHVAMEMFTASAGIKLLHVPFRGAGPALTALLSGTVQALASAPGTLKQQVDDGKMRVLANWGAERIASFTDLPTFRELGYKDVEFYIWAGLFAQSALPAPTITRLREAMAQAVKAPEVTKTFEVAGSPVAYLDAPEFSKFMAGDSARLIAAVKKIGKVE